MKKAFMPCLCGLLGVNATVSHNSIHNGIEVRFSARPDDAEISFLKSNGFRWSSRNKLWYAKYSDTMFKRIQARFDSGEIAPGQPAPARPTPQPAVELTQQEKAYAAQRKFENTLSNNANVRAVFDMAKAGFKAFVANKPAEVPLYDTETWTLDPKKGEYYHLPPKRKRPDWYVSAVLFDKILDRISRLGGNPGLLALVKYKVAIMPQYFNKSSFDSIVRDSPQYILDPDYAKLDEYFNLVEQYTKDEDARWQEWYDENIKPDTKCFINDKGTWKEYTIKGKGYRFGNGSSATVDCERRESAWFFVRGTFAIKNIYDEPNGTSFDILYPKVRNNAYVLPKFTEFVEGKAPAEPKPETKPEPKPEPTPKITTLTGQQLYDMLKGKVDFSNYIEGEKKAIEIYSELDKEQFPYGLGKKDSIEKAIQQACYNQLKNTTTPEAITLEAFATMKFIGEAHTESMFLPALYVPVEDYRRHHLKIITEAMAAGKTIPEFVMKDYPELKVAPVQVAPPAPAPEPEPDYEFERTFKKSDITPVVAKVMPKMQQRAIIGSLEHFEIVKRIEEKAEKSRKSQDAKISKLRKQIGKHVDYNDLAIVWMHYFYAGSDWFIIHWEEDELYFGYAILNGDDQMSELGMVSRGDLTEDGRIELDFFWKPVPLSVALHKHNSRYFPESENLYEKLNLDPYTGEKLPDKAAPAINLLKMKMKAKALKLKLKLV